tara:strand:- start:748 stop:1395 length:648 start_codon:yes stop_codon:yes gene_type:complete
MKKKLIGICGLIGHGKDTAAGFLIEEGFERVSFAGVLKDAVANIFSWDRTLLEGNTSESRVWREKVDTWWSNRLGIPNFTPRYALQYIGTDVMRKHFNPDIWVAAAERKILQIDNNVVISDCRFFNELDVIKRLGGTTASVWRHDLPKWWDIAVTTNTTPPEEEYQIYDHGNHMEVAFPDIHPSEFSWAGWEFNHTMYNTSTLEVFRQNTIKLLC